MPQTDFLNVNACRAYPFLAQTTGLPVDGPLTLNNLPQAVIVDAGFIAGPRSRFDADEHSVYLSSITRSGSTFTFTFECDAPALIGVPLLFTRDVGDEEYLTEHADSGQEGFSLSGSDSAQTAACDEPLWSGYLVTGDLAELAVFLSGNGTVSAGDVATTAEPATIINLAGSFVSSLSVANADRTRVTGAENCDDPYWPYPTGGVFIYERCIIGNVVVFKPGYSAVIRQNASDNSLTFLALVGAGEGQPCAELELFDGETSPDGSVLLSGGPQCNDVLRSINGIGGPILQIFSDLGANIIPLPEENTLVIDLDMSGLAICHDSASVVSESLTSESL